MLAALDRIGINADEGEEAGDGGADAIVQKFLIRQEGGGWRRERAQHGDGTTGGAARRVNTECGGVAQALDARAILSRLRQAIAPLLSLSGGEVIGADA